MHERIKMLRKVLNLTQQEFADRLGIKRGTMANYEIGRNEPIDAVISLLCKTFNVNELWLRTGKGEMFVSVPETQIEAVIDELGLTDLASRIVRGYLHLSEADQAAVKRFVQNIVNEQAIDGHDEKTAFPADMDSTEANEALYRSSFGYVPSVDASVWNTTGETESDPGVKMA